jgi:UDP-N-acetylmuramate dehydrogenase
MSWYEKLDQKVGDYLPDLKIERDAPMSRRTSFRIGGPAKRLALPTRGEQVVLLASFAKECGAETLIVGNGTNLLIADEGLDRLVIDTVGMNQITLLEDGTSIQAETGVPLARLADFAQKHGLAGLEFAHGIPGTLGGAVCMNAGAYGGEMKQVLERVTALFEDEGVRTLSNQELALGYRHSLFTDRPDGVVLSAVLRLRKGDGAEIRAKMEELMARRRASQPLEFPSAGSTFKRPEGNFAGTLIDQCGLKGLTVGGAQVSEKHAGFVINIGGATAADVTELIRQVQQRVREEKGIQLEPEVKIIR